MLCDAWTFLPTESQTAEECKAIVKQRERTFARDCVFPFNYKNKKYFACTTDDSDNGKAWCPTKVDSNNNVVTGKWGDCTQGCFQNEGSTKRGSSGNICLEKSLNLDIFQRIIVS